jgi:hypothetical protein
MANVIPAAPISAFPVVIAGPTGPTGPSSGSAASTAALIAALIDVVRQLEVRVEALEARLHERE